MQKKLTAGYLRVILTDTKNRQAKMIPPAANQKNLLYAGYHYMQDDTLLARMRS